MCGFVGITGDSTSENLIINALKSIKHRGPDNEKIFSSSDIKLGFVRLAIQDVSDISNQPIYHPSKKFIIVFNGEIYNHLELRKFINSNKNKSLYSTSKSDTITLLGLIDELGIKRTLELIKGMFAIAVYFFEEKELFLIRDHFGQKPLFYTFNNGNIIFGSEIKAISKLQNRNLEFNLINTLLPVLQTHLPDNNRTIFKDIFSLMPGELLHIKEGKYKNSEFYFTPEDLVSEEIYNNLNKKNINELSSIFYKSIQNSVKNHLISDVPIGTLFSAGLDSSIIGRIAEKQGNNFRIGFKNKSKEDDYYYNLFDKYSESETNFTDINEKECIINLPFLLEIYETINKPDGLILSNLTKYAKDLNYKVLLNGDSSDEIFSGYSYFTEIYNDTKSLDYRNVRLFRKILDRLFPSLTNNKYQNNGWLNYHNFLPNNIELFEPYLDVFQYKDSRLQGWNNSLRSFDFIRSKREQIMMAFTIDEIKNRLPRYLHRSDSYGMMHSIEMRAPFLDLDFIRLAINTPTKFKIAKLRNFNDFNYRQKYVLKEVAKKCNVPRSIIYRRKKGTTFSFYENMYKIIRFYKFDYISEIFSVSEKRLKSSIRERSQIKNYPYDSLGRYAYNILSLQVIADIFIKKIKPYDISNQFRKILNT